jgi:hypothetical protein
MLDNKVPHFSIIIPTRVTICFQFVRLITSTCFEHFITHRKVVLYISKLVYFVLIMSAGCYIYSASWWWANKCSKLVEADNRNKLKAHSVYCWSYYADILWCTVNKIYTLHLFNKSYENFKDKEAYNIYTFIYIYQRDILCRPREMQTHVQVENLNGVLQLECSYPWWFHS